MAEATILICDGCELPQTSKKAVHPFSLTTVADGEDVSVMHGDAHDWNCFGRMISRRRKAIREAAKAEKAAGSKSAKK